jgi:hypothetical protein
MKPRQNSTPTHSEVATMAVVFTTRLMMFSSGDASPHLRNYIGGAELPVKGNDVMVKTVTAQKVTLIMGSSTIN